MTDAAKKAARLEEIVEEQANDGGLWFIPQLATEEYLQRALRRLHAHIEDDKTWLATHEKGGELMPMLEPEAVCENCKWPIPDKTDTVIKSDDLIFCSTECYDAYLIRESGRGFG